MKKNCQIILEIYKINPKVKDGKNTLILFK